MSKKNQQFHYYGFTSLDVESRLKRHNKGDVRSTKAYRPLKIVGFKRFNNKKEAISFEKKLKRSADFRNKFIESFKLD
jgi:putative endonuclease